MDLELVHEVDFVLWPLDLDLVGLGDILAVDDKPAVGSHSLDLHLLLLDTFVVVDEVNLVDVKQDVLALVALVDLQLVGRRLELVAYLERLDVEPQLVDLVGCLLNRLLLESKFFLDVRKHQLEVFDVFGSILVFVLFLELEF